MYAKAGTILMLSAIFIVHYYPEPMFVIAGVFVLGLLLYIYDR